MFELERSPSTRLASVSSTIRVPIRHRRHRSTRNGWDPAQSGIPGGASFRTRLRIRADWSPLSRCCTFTRSAAIDKTVSSSALAREGCSSLLEGRWTIGLLVEVTAESTIDPGTRDHVRQFSSSKKVVLKKDHPQRLGTGPPQLLALPTFKRRAYSRISSEGI